MRTGTASGRPMASRRRRRTPPPPPAGTGCKIFSTSRGTPAAPPCSTGETRSSKNVQGRLTPTSPPTWIRHLRKLGKTTRYSTQEHPGSTLGRQRLNKSSHFCYRALMSITMTDIYVIKIQEKNGVIDSASILVS